MQNPEWSSLGDREYTVDIGGWIGGGWAMFQQDIGPFIGFILVQIGLVSALASIPILGWIGSLVILPVLSAGFLIYSFKILREQPRSFSDFFEGFNQFSSLLGFAIASWLLELLPLLPGLILQMVLVGSKLDTVINKTNIDQESIVQDLASSPYYLVTIILLLIGWLFSTYLGVSYSMGAPLILDRRAKFWPAMEMSRKVVSKKWLSIFLFLFVLRLMNILGFISCCLGLAVTVPLSMCATAYGYSQIFGLAPKVSLSNTFD